MSLSLLSKKKDQSLNETLCLLCKNLLRFIDRKIIKKYVFPNVAQLPKELRESENILKNQGKAWTYFYKEKEITEEDKIKDVFKDEKFLANLQNLTNSLIVVVEYLEQNQYLIKSAEEETKNKEEKLNSLNEIKNILNNYFDKNEENKLSNNYNKFHILEDQNLLNIMSKLQTSNKKNIVENKTSQNVIDFNKVVNNNLNVSNNNFNNNNNSDEKNKISTNLDKNEGNNDNIIINNKQTNLQKNDNNDFVNNIKAKTFLEDNKQADTVIKPGLSSPQKNDIEPSKIESIKSEPDSDDKNKINNLIDSYKIAFFNKDLIKENNNNNNVEKVENFRDNILLNKKIERETFNDKEETKNNINIDNPSSDKKKSKNKKNKNKNKKSKDINTQMELKEEIKNLPALKPKEENNKEIISFAPEHQENKDQENSNKEQKELGEINIILEKEKDNEMEKISFENEFNLGIKTELYDLDPNNNRAKTIREILSLIKKNGIKNYNPRINGPYLVGSYRTVPDLPSINYFAPIDIMYTFKDILIDKKIVDYSINNLIKENLKLNIIESSLGQNYDENSGISKIIVKCSSELNLSLIISFNIYFMDIGNETNEKILNNFIFKGDKMNFESKDIEKKFIYTILFLRIWRKKNKFFFIIPEILDEIAKHFIQKYKIDAALCILKVFFYLYNIDFNPRKNTEDFPKHKSFLEKTIKKWFENEEQKEMIKKSVLETIYILNNKKYSEIFNNYDCE